MSISDWQLERAFAGKTTGGGHFAIADEGLREKAQQGFWDFGLPHKKLEGFKHTSLAALAQRTLQVADVAQIDQDAVDKALSASPLWAAKPGYTLVLCDGHFVPELSAALNAKYAQALPAGVMVSDLASLEGQHLALWQEEYQASLKDLGAEDSLLALNAALAQDGLGIFVGKGKSVDAAIHIVHLISQDARLTNSRLFVHIGAQASANLYESFLHLGAKDYFQNDVHTQKLEAGARLGFVRWQDSGVGAFSLRSERLRLGRDTTLSGSYMSVGEGCFRAGITLAFEGPGAEGKLVSTALGCGDSHHDITAVASHGADHCQSNILVKNILDDSSSSVFNAKADVRPDVKHSSAHQTNRNLLLSKGAKVNTRPQLEIYNDEVQASHGATVGQLDEAQIFYMRARGIPEAQARRELTLAFAEESLEEIPDETLRTRLAEAFRERLQGEQNQGA